MQKISEYVCSLTLTAEAFLVSYLRHALENLQKTHKKLVEKLEKGCAKKGIQCTSDAQSNLVTIAPSAPGTMHASNNLTFLFIFPCG